MLIKERLFRALLARFESRPPELVRRVQLQILLNTTADGFEMQRVRIWHKSAADALEAYAAFTKDCMAARANADPARLYEVSYRLGARLRRVTGFTQQTDIERLVFFLYRGIGIAMSGSIPGEITVSGCFFSRVYAPAQCQLISAMDSGIVAGLCGGGALHFTRRITEGCRCCTALFQK